jgi:hypothetical protein
MPQPGAVMNQKMIERNREGAQEKKTRFRPEMDTA